MTQLLEHLGAEPGDWEVLDMTLSEESQERARLDRLAVLFSPVVRVYASGELPEPAPVPDNIDLGYNRQ